MNNDLISREALKEALQYLKLINYNNSGFSKIYNNAIQTCIEEIDDAPTVEYTFEEAFQKTVCDQKLYCPERPQGEWIFLKANEEQTDGYECSVCKATYHTKVPYFSEFNFCPNCGAKMQKGGAE